MIEHGGKLMPRYTHVSFSDESNWNSGRFRSIGMVSGSVQSARALHEAIKDQLTESDVRETKWKKTRTAKHRFAVIKLVDECFKSISSGAIRIDVLTWDSTDERHSIRNPDLVGNLQRMYFHLFKNVMTMRWPSTSIWRHMPDEHSGMDWNRVRTCLDAATIREAAALSHVAFADDETFGATIRRLFGIHEIGECQSHDMCLIQAADVFAGLGCFSLENYARYASWKAELGYSSPLFPEVQANQPSSGAHEKFTILLHVETWIKRIGFPIDIRTTRGLITLDPSLPLNFWLYRAQSIRDKAPTKTSGAP
jgi:hypothetical protein